MTSATLHTQPSSLPATPREERRKTDLDGWFVRLSDRATFDFTVVNLSYGGCRIRTVARLRPGETIRLSFKRLGVIDALVRWCSGSEFGLAFEGALDGKRHTPRTVPRHKASLQVLVRRPGRRSQWIDATDVSQRGCCLQFVDPPRAGDRLWVQLPGLEAIEAEVRWINHHQAGTVFQREIHPAVFDLLMQRWLPGSA